jgi:hypothetical protein
MAVQILICSNLCSGRQLFFNIFWRISPQKEGRRTNRKLKKWGIVSEKIYYPWLDKVKMKVVLMNDARKLKAHLHRSSEPYRKFENLQVGL